MALGNSRGLRTWAQVTAGAGWTGRTGHTSVALPDGRMVLIGGYTPYPG